MKIYDCFTFFNELDLLEIRLSILDKVVDHFVIIESNYSHSGKQKKYNFLESKQRYEKWENKIIYYPIKQSIDGLAFEEKISAYNPTSTAWILENDQRDAIKNINYLLENDDIILVSDLDEIPNPKVIKNLKLENEPFSLEMLLHYYFLNCQNIGDSRWWSGTVITNGKLFKQTTPQTLRNNRDNYKKIKNAGWHFSYLGGVEKIKHKIQSFAHQEYNKEEFLNDEELLNFVINGKDIFNRQGEIFLFVTPHFYPKKLQQIIKKYPHLLYYPLKMNLFQKFMFEIGYKLKLLSN